MILSAIRNGNTITLYKNGAEIAKKTDLLASQVFYTPGLSLSDLGLSLGGDLGEVLGYGVGIIDANRDTNHTYLGNKWRIALA